MVRQLASSTTGRQSDGDLRPPAHLADDPTVVLRLAAIDPQPARLLNSRHEAISTPIEVTFGGVNLIVPRGVFCPTLTRTSRLLLDVLAVTPGMRVLDAFTGSGAFGVIAALHGASVEAIDRDPRAVLACRINASRNHVAHRVVAQNCAIASYVPAARKPFDLMIANPPLLPGEPEGIVGHAMFDPGLRATLDFLDVVQRYLAPNGRCLLLTSSVIDQMGLSIARECDRRGLWQSIAAQRDCGYEVYYVHEITRARND